MSRRQLDLDALRPVQHRYEGADGRAVGYVGRCACGWHSDEKPTKRAAQGAVAAHIGAAR